MTLSSATGNVVVLDVGGTTLKLGHIRQGASAPQFKTLSSDRLRVAQARQAIITLIQDYAESIQLKPDVVVLGLPGMLDHSLDNFTHCNNIPQLEGYGLRAALEEALTCRVILEQDIMLQLLGEWRNGAAKGCQSVFGVYFGTGIGAAYLVNGDPHTHSEAGLQAGHIPIMAEGKPCVCGNTDCVEAYACGHTLIEYATTYGFAVEHLFVEKHNPRLTADLDRFVLYQSFMIATLVTLFVPDMIVIGGGIPKMVGYPREQLIANVRKHLRKPYPAESVTINWATLDDQATSQGAMALLEINSSST